MAGGRLKLKPQLTFKKPTGKLDVGVCTFSDAIFNQTRANDYGKSGVISGIGIQTSELTRMFHPIDWTTQKQRRVCHSSYGAEIIAVAEGGNRYFYST